MNYIYASPATQTWQEETTLAAIARLVDDLSFDWNNIYGIDDGNGDFDPWYSLFPNDVIRLNDGKFAVCGKIEHNVDPTYTYGFLLTINGDGTNPIIKVYEEVNELTSVIEQHGDNGALAACGYSTDEDARAVGIVLFVDNNLWTNTVSRFWDDLYNPIGETHFNQIIKGKYDYSTNHEDYWVVGTTNDFAYPLGADIIVAHLNHYNCDADKPAVVINNFVYGGARSSMREEGKTIVYNSQDDGDFVFVAGSQIEINNDYDKVSNEILVMKLYEDGLQMWTNLYKWNNGYDLTGVYSGEYLIKVYAEGGFDGVLILAGYGTYCGGGANDRASIEPMLLDVEEYAGSSNGAIIFHEDYVTDKDDRFYDIVEQDYYPPTEEEPPYVVVPAGYTNSYSGASHYSEVDVSKYTYRLTESCVVDEEVDITGIEFEELEATYENIECNNESLDVKYVEDGSDEINCGEQEDNYYNKKSKPIIEAETNKEILLYPNPGQDFTYIYGLEGTAEYSIYSTDGRLVMQGNTNDSKIIAISKLPKGQYIIQIKSNNELTKRKFIKE